jgi:Ca2+-binding EF-hand superfamily protein
MKRAGHYPNEEEIVAAIRRLDLDADSSVSYAEFSEAIKPQEFSIMNHYVLPSQEPIKLQPSFLS